MDFDRSARLKAYFADRPLDANPPPLYINSIWTPPRGTYPSEVDARLYHFLNRVRLMFRRRRRCKKSNLLPFQQRILRWLKNHKEIIIANTDKNLGPCAVERSRYIRDALKHIQNDKVYALLSPEEAKREVRRVETEINLWMYDGRRMLILGDEEYKFIRQKNRVHINDPWSYFYLLYKVHKPKLSTRPVCSDCASITYAIGKWVDIMLQPIAKQMPTYIQDSFGFKQLIDELKLPSRARLFTADAVSMYTNIDTDYALSILCPYLIEKEDEFGHYDADFLIRAIEIVMRNNILKFGDVYARQISGTAMGKPPAPSWANCVEGLHELQTLPTYTTSVPFYKRYIDDVFGVWVPPDDCTEEESNDLWNDFKGVINSRCLEWEFTERQLSAQFLDLTLTIDNTGRIKTRLYEKPMALYLFIPPHSAHPPGVRVGHIYGNVLRIFRLNTDEKDIVSDVLTFFRRFQRRGHPTDELKPLFFKAITNAREYLAKSSREHAIKKEQKHEEAKRRLYFHLEYHPDHPKGSRIQQAFDETMLHPSGEQKLYEIKSNGGFTIPIEAMVIANHRARNLGDIFSYRDISKRDGPPASSYL